MFDVVLDVKNLSVPALVTRIKAIIAATSDLPVYASLSAKLTALPSGQKVWGRLRACNARGKSNWSDPACRRVP
jgi:hypothetical protein